MKVGIVTFHRAVNYGAVLQAYALCTSIRNLGYECDVIDYRCPFIEAYYSRRKLFAPRNWKRLIAYVLHNGNLSPDKERFFTFLKGRGVMSKQTYNNSNELKETNSIYDCFITGSDQVWNYTTAGFDRVFFLDFVEDSQKKLSYAASFGFSQLPTEYIYIYRNLLKDFSSISIREKAGQRIIESLVNVPVTVDLDPTLLLSREEWENVSALSVKSYDEDYILVYMIGEDERLLDLARHMAQERKMSVYYISDRWRNKKNVQNMRKMGIEDWVNLFQHATYVITNSFHGTAFSVCFRKNFVVVGNQSGQKKESRILTLLDDISLKNRLTYDLKEAQKTLTNPIDFDASDHMLEQRRKESLNHLRLQLESKENKNS